ncbi:hypothetical protein FNU76_07760 [Chitinimonas arctica]|uniref:Glycosyltransferase n=1 Tax=Chitinimonas arctica TaxID=2594795 RepID=A0A516SDM8_9NEIS|nr:hypothetical protein [Chitinimonas arctica]QDQ26263.1 hypothetical protein FNU76_07760 [Chitinimonas arctica]
MDKLQPTVIILSGAGSGDAINGMMTSLAVLIGEQGVRTEYFDVSKWQVEDIERFSRAIESGTILFALTYLGVGQDFSAAGPDNQPINIWEHFNIPLIKLHGDSPAYFLDRHADFPANSVNLYVSEEFTAFHRWMLPNSKAISACCDPWLVADVAREQVDFQRKKQGKLIYIKNGGSVDELTRMWREKLAPRMAEQLLELAEFCKPAALSAQTFPSHEIVANYLADQKIDIRGMKDIVRLYVAQLDDYMRRIKSTMIAKALLPFPVLIQGANWDHLDMSNAQARIVETVDFHACNTVIQDALGIIDMSPNVNNSCHERMMRAAGLYTFGLTNKSNWLEGVMPALNERAFDFSEESIQASVSQALADPEACIDLGRRFGDAYRQRYQPAEFFNHLVRLSEYARLIHAKEKPELQSFYAW